MSEKKKNIFIIFILIFLILFFIAIAVLSFKFENKNILKINNINAEINQIQLKFNSTQRHAPALKKMEPQLAELFLDADDSLDFLAFLEREAKKLDLDISANVQVPSDIDKTNLQNMNIKIIANGNLNSLLQLESFLQTLPYIGYLRYVRLEQTGDTNKWSGDFELHIFIKKNIL